MKSKFFSSLLVLALISNSLAPIAAQAQSSDDKTVYELSQAQPDVAKSAIQSQSTQVQNMSITDIQSKLNASADAADAFAADPANHLNSDQQARFKKLSLSMRKQASDPKIKKKMLKALSHTGETALISLAIAGSTLKQATFLPLAILSGLFGGLANDKIDKTTADYAYLNDEAWGVIVLVELCVMGPLILPAFFTLFGGLAADAMGQNICATPSSDEYLAKLCHDFNQYDTVLDKGAEEGASAIGYGIDHSVIFVFKGPVELARKIFKKKSK